MKTKVNYLRKYNDTNTYSQTINVICSEKEFISMKEVVKQYINNGHTPAKERKRTFLRYWARLHP